MRAPRPPLACLVAGLLPALLSGCPYVSEAEVLDRLDPDRDGVYTPRDCDDADPEVGIIWRSVDADQDGWGGGAVVESCAAAAGLADRGGDCDDAAGGVNPGADELCNDLDDDCDGYIDEDAVDRPAWFPDADGDGYGDPAFAGTPACEAPSGAFVDNDDDCDDGDPATGAARAWFRDADGDGYGDPETRSESCVAGPGQVADGSDCDDLDPDVHPGATEVCDRDDVDEDCDGLADDLDDEPVGERAFFADADGDGWGDLSAPVEACDAPSGAVADDSDCDDTVADTGVQEDCPWAGVSVGTAAVCGLRSNGRLRCTSTIDAIEDDAPEEAVVSVAVGARHACAVEVDGDLRCWGEGSLLEQVGEVEGAFVQVSVERNLSCALDAAGLVTCWGDGISYAVSPADGGAYTEVQVGTFHACALRSDAAVDCFGSCSEEGECADGADTYRGVAAGHGFSCAARSADATLFPGAVECWGDAPGTALSLNAGGATAQVSAYGPNVCVLDEDGAVVCASGAGVDLSPPSSAFSAISVGALQACGITTGGDLVCWPGG